MLRPRRAEAQNDPGNEKYAVMKNAEASVAQTGEAPERHGARGICSGEGGGRPARARLAAAHCNACVGATTIFPPDDRGTRLGDLLYHRFMVGAETTVIVLLLWARLVAAPAVGWAPSKKVGASCGSRAFSRARLLP